MIKNFITAITITLLCSYSFSQTQLLNVEQKTLLVNSNDKNKVHYFQEQLKVKIEHHRTEMRARKEVLEREKETLRNDIKVSKQQNNGKLTEQQKTDLKSKLELIESKSFQLKKENFEFISSIDKEREFFFASIKNKQLNKPAN